MAKLTPRTPKGMRDYLPGDMLKRQYVFDVVRGVFESYGFEPIDTPVLELQETLDAANYGQDAQKLIYHARHTGGKEKLALRYDLTVPLSRFFAANENELGVPFRRYHIAPVWRGERPQKGRYREFYQCDADIVGIRSMAADAEAVSVVYTALNKLGFADFSIKMNNRKLLTGIGTYAGIPDDQLGSLYRLIDKTDKIGLDGIAEEMRKEGMQDDVIQRMTDLLSLDGSGDYQKRLAALGQMKELMDEIPIGFEGIEELEELTLAVEALGIPADNSMLDFTMVRGLGYYTGPIFETQITKPDNLGSVQGGGRYDELIGTFRGQSLPTTGISLGIERIIDLMDMLNLYPESMTGTVVETLVTTFNTDLQLQSLQLATQLRSGGIRTETYMDGRKSLGKQIGYASTKGVQMIVVMGPDEHQNNQVQLKRLADGHEETVPRASIVERVKALLNKT